MPNQPATANMHHLSLFPVPQPWDAPDPLPIMRREMKLLLIELNVLRVEVEQLRALKEEVRNTEECFSASIKHIKASRDQWRREAERLRSLTDTAPAQVRWLDRLLSHPSVRLALSLAMVTFSSSRPHHPGSLKACSDLDQTAPQAWRLNCSLAPNFPQVKGSQPKCAAKWPRIRHI